ncbi:Monomeric sarcosine oxidase [Thalassovita gelatinovora]|uniref:Monomeric sarcosine oxidase n=1 Tax=Thalassovita gelatinovora TaxID=53501 RepID=A0A0P1G2X7_THAGE|nr:FAD-dependent oxidoreductase [Thalassovita gelatinovora]QIZ81407.1 FAD-dependent oxidoreductase [Thalassovita gelatinovora]CUH66183.1 Monomeric sarcosine oxidase [Thalassovita gelatinovora]SEQ21426.1 sarcosine oxidase [Thalassovita gelatinovora]
MRIAVVGRGMIGSAAARHLAKQGQEVILIGPSEPADPQRHDGVFASHYDEGRITRSLDPSPFWSRASRDSIARYDEIEAASGVRFFHETGLIMAGPEGSEPISEVDRGAARDGIMCEAYRGTDLAARFGYFSFGADTLALFEPRRAGHINPRALVRAQGIAAQRAGAQVLDTVATGLREDAAGVTVQTSQGEVAADQVLVAAGGFSKTLLGESINLRVYARTVLLLEVDAEEQARLAGMPPLIWLGPAGEDPYLLPPIRYPDGRMYLKIGGDPGDVALNTDQDMRDWFRSGGNPQVGALLEDAIRARMPGLRSGSSKIAACVTSYSDDGLALIERLNARVSVATAGCGKAAKNSDELGRLGAEVALGRALPDWAARS